MRLRIDLAYDGGPFAGFARQPDRDTVQGALEGALSRVVGHPVATTCAGRTDRGVHALGQVVSVDVSPTDPRGLAALDDLAGLARRLHRMTDAAISVWSVVEVPDGPAGEGGFDARFSATARRYVYRLAEHHPDPRDRGGVWRVGHDLDVAAMAHASTVLVGEHDFASFCRAAPGRTTVRDVTSITVDAIEQRPVVGARGIEVRVDGTAFCHQQVRSIVGSLVEVGRGRRDTAWLAAALAARDRAAAGPVAPPHGLTLASVEYVAPFPPSPLVL